MVANYPNGLPTLPELQENGVDIVDADDVNLVYTELTAVAETLGLTPATRSAAWSSTAFTTATTSFGTVGARIKNAEDGVQVITASAVTKAGATNVITPSGTSTVNLAVKAQTSQTANVFEARDSSDAVGTAINASGYIVTIDGGSA
jgi:hypothetical protein